MPKQSLQSKTQKQSLHYEDTNLDNILCLQKIAKTHLLKQYLHLIANRRIRIKQGRLRYQMTVWDIQEISYNAFSNSNIFQVRVKSPLNLSSFRATLSRINVNLDGK